jgi:hypothetical protein
MRLLRGVLIFKLGALVGMMVAAAVFKRVVTSSGDEESDEVSLVAIFDGKELKSRAQAFRGGSMLAWFGGIEADLRDAELAPGAQLAVNAIFGGIELRTPPGWRIESDVKAIAGGISVPTAAEVDPAAPVLTLVGGAYFGGVDVSSKADAAS